jgi:hypothetical protein
MTIKDWARELKPPTNGEDPTPWRFKMWGTVLLILALGTLYLLADFGAFERIGISAGARAQDVEQVRSELKADIGRLERKVDAQGETQNEILRLAMITELCRIYWLRMGESGVLLQQLNDTFERLQTNYAALNNGARFPAVECGPQR